MFEATTLSTSRRAFEAAHQERARAIKGAFAWLFPSKTLR